MGISGGPDLIQDGLVLCLDASDKNSYPGSGTTWTNMVSSNNGTLTNGPTFNSANNGSIVFDGVDDYVLMSSPINVSNRFTVNAWVKLSITTPQPTTYGNRITLISNCYPYSAGKGFFMVASGNNGSDFFISLGNDQKIAISNTGYISANKVFMITATVNAGDSNIKLYYNGSEVTYAVQNDGNVALSYDTGNTQIGYRNGSDIMNGNIYSFQLYNRALSSIEILQNYNAQKSRFGL
jgi:hypothetical protein